MTTLHVAFDLPLFVSPHGKGQVVVTSSLVPRLSVSARNKDEALRKVLPMLVDLARAAMPPTVTPSPRIADDSDAVPGRGAWRTRRC